MRGQGVSMVLVHLSHVKRLPSVVLLFSTALLGGCFLADKDQEDPIVPAATLAYPMKFGDARQCENSSSDEPDCKPARIERRQDGGYVLTVWSVNDDGSKGDPSSEGYKLRELKGAGVPQGTYLAQTADDDPDKRYLGLLKRREEGGWLRVQPQCDGLPAARFVAFMTSGWIFTDPDAKLDDVTCYVSRDGLSDARLYEILDAAGGDSGNVIFEGG